MSHLEEQAEEVEALQAIYLDEFEIIQHPTNYRIKLTPNDEKENHGKIAVFPLGIFYYVNM